MHMIFSRKKKTTQMISCSRIPERDEGHASWRTPPPPTSRLKIRYHERKTLLCNLDNEPLRITRDVIFHAFCEGILQYVRGGEGDRDCDEMRGADRLDVVHVAEAGGEGGVLVGENFDSSHKCPRHR